MIVGDALTLRQSWSEDWLALLEDARVTPPADPYPLEGQGGAALRPHSAPPTEGPWRRPGALRPTVITGDRLGPCHQGPLMSTVPCGTPSGSGPYEINGPGMSPGASKVSLGPP